MRNLGDLFIILDKHRQLTRLDKSKLAEDLIEILVEEVKASMDAETAPDGTPWPELSDNPEGRGYRSWKDAHYPGKPIGELTGKMKEEDQIRGTSTIVFDRVYIRYGTDDEVRKYAMAFHHGREDGSQPARPFLGFSPRCEQRQHDAITQFLEDALRESS